MCFILCMSRALLCKMHIVSAHSFQCKRISYIYIDNEMNMKHVAKRHDQSISDIEPKSPSLTLLSFAAISVKPFIGKEFIQFLTVTTILFHLYMNIVSRFILRIIFILFYFLPFLLNFVCIFVIAATHANQSFAYKLV